MPISLERAGLKYAKLDAYKFKGFDEDEIESYGHLKLPSYNAGDKARKILFVLDYVPAEDLKSGSLLSGHQGQLLSNIVRQVSENVYLKKSLRFSWLACTFNAFRTAGKPKSFQNNAQVAFAKRIEFVIGRYKPDVVVLMGRRPCEQFLKEQLDLTDGKISPWLGVPLRKTVRDHECNFYATLSLDTLAVGTGTGGESALCGYVGRNLANAISDTHNFKIDAERVRNHKSVLVNTVKKFDKLMDVIEANKGPVAIDTETKNLNRLVNGLLTVQMSKCVDIGYLIPIHHKDTPFLPEELRYVKKRLKRFFESKNKNKYHIYTNAGFDLNVLRTQLGVRFFKNDVYDILAGEFCFHPDTLILTETGWMGIDEFIDLPKKPKLLSFNHKKGAFEYKDVILTSRHQTVEKMYEIEYEGGTLRVTGNHKVWSITRNAYVRADEICLGEDVAIPE